MTSPAPARIPWLFMFAARPKGTDPAGWLIACALAAGRPRRHEFKGTRLMRVYLADPGASREVIAARAGTCKSYVYYVARVARELPWLAPEVAAGRYPLCLADQLAQRHERRHDVTRAGAMARPIRGVRHRGSLQR